MRLPIDVSKISEKDRTNPTVLLLLESIQKQAELIQELKDEIARLKGQSPRPKIRPSRLENTIKSTGKRKGKKGSGSRKKKKTVTLQIHDTIPIEPEDIPDGAVFKGYNDFIVQGLKIEAHNIRYRLKAYETPDGKYICAKLPDNLKGKHFSPDIVCFILYQYHQCGVTQPLLLEQLQEFGIDISKGTLNSILNENKNDFHKEKDQILAAGLEVSSYVNVDDTGARHMGKNGYCTHIGNEAFSWFESTGSKSRINFLQLLRAGHSDYSINVDAIAYMLVNKLPKQPLNAIIANRGTIFSNESQWQEFLVDNDIKNKRHQQIATEGVLLGSIIEYGISKNMVIVSDDAGQFNILSHALCWVHAERLIQKIIPFSDKARKDLETIRDQIWHLYKNLKEYKQSPNDNDKKRLQNLFDQIFNTKTHSAMLNEALKRINGNKSELLLVLDRPDIPLHNNSAENAIRDYVKKRKISGSTRSDSGRKCRDTFTSLKKTCRKLGVSFWQYLHDRICGLNKVPKLSDLIRQQILSTA